MEVTSSIGSSEGPSAVLRPGALVGRGPNADLQLADPRVSVGHAGVDLRYGQLCLLRYRGTLWVGGKEASDTVIAHKGLEVKLASDIAIRITEVYVPDTVPTLAVDDRGPIPLFESVWHLEEWGAPRWGSAPDRPVIFDALGSWYVREPGQAPRALPEGAWVSVAGHRLRFAMLPRSEAGDSTHKPHEVPPLTIQSSFEETLVQIEGRPPIRLYGVSHRVIRELGRLTVHDEVCSVHWLDVAERVWQQNHQKRWEHKKVALQKELGDLGLPPDLFRTDRGVVQLHLRPGDQFELRDPHLHFHEL